MRSFFLFLFLIEIHHSSNEVISLAPGRLLTMKHVRLQGERAQSVFLTQ